MGDFTPETYEGLYCAVDANKVFAVGSFLKEKPESTFVIVRHDVDRKPENALRMAELDQKVMK